MDAKELADKFSAKLAAAVVERDRQITLAEDNKETRLADAEHCKRAMTEIVVPFLWELKHHFTDDHFSFSPQVDLKDNKVVGVSFSIGNGPVTSISTAFGNVIVTYAGSSGSSNSNCYIYPPSEEPYISNSGDLTREKIAKLIEMTIDSM